MRVNKKIKLGVALLAAGIVLTGGVSTYAAGVSNTFSQTINAGVLSTFVGDSTGAEVAAPSVTFPAQTVSNAVQTSVGSYGTSAQRIYIDNPGGAPDGWTLTLAATNASDTWTDGTDTYPYNGTTSADGQLTIDPSAATYTAVTGTSTGITVGASGTFSGGTNTPVTLATSDGSGDSIARGYLTGVSASQTIPASTPAGTYTIDFTQTVTAQ